MKHYLFITICALSIIATASSCRNRNKVNSELPQDSVQDTSTVVVADSLAEEKSQIVMDKIATLSEEPIFDIVTTMGVIKVKLYSKTPQHRDNFAKLAFEKFYDGILFHRVINGFMIQTGDPNTKGGDPSTYGMGGPGYNVPAEFVPEYTHIKGALAAARRGDAANPMKESSGSQFYIVQNPQTCAQLDGAYTVFGETIEGLNIIDNIAAVDTDRRDRPVQDIKIITIKLAE